MNYWPKMRVLGAKWGRDGAMLTPTNSLSLLVGSYICANFGKNRARNATARVRTDGYTDILTDASRFYNLSHAIFYSYLTDNNTKHPYT